MKYLHFFIFLFVLAGCQNTIEDSSEDVSNETDLSGSVTIEGTELKYFAKGTGLPFVVIGSSADYFSSDLEKNFQLFFFETRATAENYSPIDTAKYTLQTLLEDIDALRSAVGLQKFIVGGHSIMGVIAYEYSKKYPEYVSHVVMIGSPSIYGAKEFQDALSDYWETAPEERKALFEEKQKQMEGTLDQLSPREAMVKSIVSQSPKRWHDPNFDATEFLEKVSFNMDFASHLFGNLFSSYHMFGPDEKPLVPLLIATGKSDYVSPPTLWIGKYDNLPNLTISYFEESGHTPHYEESDLFNERLIEWVKNN